jgi:hypothetical protein
MIREPRCICNRADREYGGLVEHVEGVLVAGCFCGQDNLRLLESFGIGQKERRWGYEKKNLQFRRQIMVSSSRASLDLRDLRAWH